MYIISVYYKCFWLTKSASMQLLNADIDMHYVITIFTLRTSLLP